MGNYNKIKALVEAGFWVEVHDTARNACCIYFNSNIAGRLYRSFWCNTLDACHDYIGADYDTSEDIKNTDLKLTPVPRRYNEIKGKVDILDLPELRKIIEKSFWDVRVKEMIGQKGLEIDRYINDHSGQGYYIWQKDKKMSCMFPIWAVVPHFDDQEVETIKIGDMMYNKHEVEEALKDIKSIK